MVKYLIGALCILISLPTLAQSSRKQQRIAEEIYEMTDPFLDKAPKEVPAEHENASAVGLGDITLETYGGKAGKLERLVYFRLHIKIQDKAARERFSTFKLKSYSYFSWFGGGDERVYAIKIKKPSGEEKVLDVESLSKNADGEIAIPGLEIGDILDYGLKFKNTKYNTDCFSSSISAVNESYPILYGFKRMNVERGFFVNFKSLHGAPELVKNEQLSDRRTLVYEMEYSNLKARASEVWSPINRTEPTIKSRVCYHSIRRADKADKILGDPYGIKSVSSDDEKARALEAKYDWRLRGSDRFKYFQKWMHKNFEKNELSDEEYMRYAFYHVRYFSLIYSSLSDRYMENYLTRYVKPTYFAKLMHTIAENRNIENEVVFTANKDVSSFDDIIIMPEFRTLFRYKSEKGEWHYFETPNSYQTIEHFSSNYSGQDALAYNFDGDFKRIKIPQSKPEDNVFRTEFKITPNLESKVGEIEAYSKSTGNFKYAYSSSILRDVEYHEQARQATLPEGRKDEMLDKGRVQRLREETLSKVEQDPADKLKGMKEMKSESFDIGEYTSFELVNSGVISSEDSLKYKERFSIKDVVEKVGPSYVIDLSKIAPDQISFTDKEKSERDNDIYINYPKTYSYRFDINIPDGYVADGLEAFREDVDTPYGRVTMDAVQKDNIVTINMEKVYKKSFAKKDEWPKFMEFLEPAMKLNDARIVLKRS